MKTSARVLILRRYLNFFRINTYIRLASVDFKGLAEMLSPLDATLTKNRGGTPVMVN
jgi:hypothetical protein